MSVRQPESIKMQVDGTTTATLEWRTGLASDLNKRVERTQKFVDNEVLRLSDRYVPFQQGGLKRSGITGTVIGSGQVRYIAPYSRYQYYGKLMVGRAPKKLTNIPLQYHSGDPNRRAKWFEIMKARHKGQIVRGAQVIMKGR